MSARPGPTLTLLATAPEACVEPAPSTSPARGGAGEGDGRRWAAYDLAARAELALVQDDAALASRLAHEALAARPGWRRALVLRARSCLALGDHDGALHAARLAALSDLTPAAPPAPQASPDESESACLLRAMASAAVGDRKGELAALEAALTRSPDPAMVRRWRGDLRRALGDLEGALEDLDIALALAVAAGDRRAEHLARRLRSAAREAARLWPGALADALACSADDRTDVDVVDRTGRVWWALGERAKARECEDAARTLRLAR